jgi:hypothetical protein
MNPRIVNWLVLVFHLTVVPFVQAQYTGKPYRVGYVSTVGSPDANFENCAAGCVISVTSRARTSPLSIVLLKAKPN